MRFFYYLATLTGLIAIVALSATCRKDLDIDPIDNPTDTSYFVIEGIRVSNGKVTQLGHTHVKITAEFNKISAQSFTIVDYGHVLSKTANLPVIQGSDGFSSFNAAPSLGDFTSEITGIDPGTTYFARVYIKKKDNATGNESYGYTDQAFSFTTLAPEPPTVVDTAINVMSSSFLMKGEVIDFKGKDLLNHGFIWSTTHATANTLTVQQNEGKYEFGPQPKGGESHSFSYVIQNLQADHTYFARAFATNDYGTGYGAVIQVNTLASPEPLVVIDTFFLASDANGTGEPNPGEQVTYTVRLKNIGEQAAENVNLILSSGDVSVISNQPIQFGTLSPNGGMQSKNIQMTLSADLSANDEVLINTEINSGTFQWTDNTTFKFIVAASPAPIVEVESFELIWDANGNNQPNPGEIVDYKVTLKNTGAVTAENVEVTFSAGVDAVVVGSQPVSYGAITTTGTKTKTIQLQLSNQLSAGDIVSVTVSVTSDPSYSWVYNNSFSFTISPPPAPDIIIQNVVLTEPNGTGNINPCEEVTITLTLKNTGDQDATGVNLSIGSSVHYDILTSLPVSFGDIPANTTKTKDVVIEINCSVPWSTFISIPVNVTAATEGPWNFPTGVQFTVISPYVVTSGMVFYTRFNECSGIDVANLAGGTSGTLFGPSFSSDVIPGASGCSLNFTATEQDYVQFPQNPTFGLNEVSFSFWLKSGTGNGYLFSGSVTSQQDDLKMLNNIFYWDGSPLNFNIGPFLDNLNWRHYVITIKAGEQFLYIDGLQKIQGTQSTGWNPANHQGCFLGRTLYMGGTNYPLYNGKMDNFRIYNRAITQAEVLSIFNAKQ